jgi:hypothetical protein
MSLAVDALPRTDTVPARTKTGLLEQTVIGALRGKPVTRHHRPAAPISGEELVEYAVREGIGPALFKAPQIDPLPRAPLHKLYAATGLRNEIMLAELGRLLEQLAAAGIDVIVLKGAALIGLLYRDSALRPMTDIDLLVRPNQVEAAAELLHGEGYRIEGPTREIGQILAYENELLLTKQTALPALLPEFVVELHWHLFDSPHHQHAIDLAWFWEERTEIGVGDRSIPVLAPSAQLIHLAGHLALHHQHRGLLWQYDIYRLLQDWGPALAWPEILEQARACELIGPLRDVLSDLAARWRAPVPPAVLAQLAAMEDSPRAMAIYASMTRAERTSTQRLWTDLAGLPTWRDRVRFAWRNIVPPPVYMRERYGLRHGWQLPLAYGYRWWLGVVGAVKGKD